MVLSLIVKAIYVFTSFIFEYNYIICIYIYTHIYIIFTYIYIYVSVRVSNSMALSRLHHSFMAQLRVSFNAPLSLSP